MKNAEIMEKLLALRSPEELARKVAVSRVLHDAELVVEWPRESIQTYFASSPRDHYTGRAFATSVDGDLVEVGAVLLDCRDETSVYLAMFEIDGRLRGRRLGKKALKRTIEKVRSEGYLEMTAHSTYPRVIRMSGELGAKSKNGHLCWLLSGATAQNTEGLTE